jgi:hypothetical protein
MDYSLDKGLALLVAEEIFKWGEPTNGEARIFRFGGRILRSDLLGVSVCEYSRNIRSKAQETGDLCWRFPLFDNCGARRMRRATMMSMMADDDDGRINNHDNDPVRH